MKSGGIAPAWRPGRSIRSPNSSDQDVGNNPTECGLSASPLWVLVVQKRAGDSIDAS